ncbi:MAG: BTAD domain-containing putative transcriptional regulator [Desulfohalobiaceae bacterium]
MQDFALKGKLKAPLVQDALQRRRLFQIMDQALKKPVLWINSPPGSGKTYLAASYIRESSRPWLWYSLEPEDQNPDFLFKHLIQAAQYFSAQNFQALCCPDPDQAAHMQGFARKFFRTFYSSLPNGFLLVWDNFQLIEAETALLEILFQSLQALPFEANILFLSRSSAPKEFVRLQAENKISFLGWEDLRFRFQETKALLADKNLSQAELKLLQNKTQGWAAGLILLAQGLRAGAGKELLVSSSAEQNVYSYLAQELFQTARPEIQDFLLQTAFLPRFSAQTAARLTSCPECQKILDYLSRRNFFIICKEHPQPEYEYHSLFRDFLLQTAKQGLSRPKLKEICQKAAPLLHQEQCFIESAELYALAADWPGLLGLIREKGPQLLEQGKIRILQKWIYSLPADILNSDPWALYWLGVCLGSSEPVQSRTLLQKAWELFCKQPLPAPGPDPAQERWPWLVRIYTLNRFQLVLKDQPLVHKGKVQQKTLELLKALLALDKGEVRQDTLQDLLWPDADGDRAHSDLSTALYRLRQLLQTKQAVLTQGGIVSLNRCHVWVDAWSFLELLQRACFESLTKSRPEPCPQESRLKLLRKAFALYKGDFLPQDTGLEWTSPMRKRLQERYLFLVLWLGQILQDCAQYHEAAEYYLQALDLMELEEEIYIQLLQCLQKVQNTALARIWAVRCKNIMAGAHKTPSARLQTLLQVLLTKP